MIPDDDRRQSDSNTGFAGISWPTGIARVGPDDSDGGFGCT
jgi:hypothetical protein